MAKHLLILAAAVLCSAAVAGFVSLQLSDRGEAGGAAAPVTGRDRLRDEVEELRRRIDLLAASPIADPGVAHRLEELDARLAEVEGAAAPPAPEPVETEPESLLPASAADMNVEALAYEARVLMGRRDYGTAVAYWEEILARDPDEERRREALYQSGLAFRMLKDHAREEARFRDWAAMEEPDSAGEMSALFQVSWSLYYQEKFDDALAVMERVARARNTYDTTRPYALIHTANFAAKVGDYARARPYCERILKEYVDAPQTQNLTWVLQRAKQLLREIDGR
jgi:tetratricopeptide (TPR) repeat protein